MRRLVETFLAEDITGNRYEIERYMALREIGTKLLVDEKLSYRGNRVSVIEDDLYYIEVLDTEVKKI
jgi:hypothetical protein